MLFQRKAAEPPAEPNTKMQPAKTGEVVDTESYFIVYFAISLIIQFMHSTLCEAVHINCEVSKRVTGKKNAV